MKALPLAQLERDRLAAQGQFDAGRPQRERNRMGQFATPPGLAADILRVLRAEVRAGTRVRFLDPAFGTGAFSSALLAAFGQRRIALAQGFEVDHELLRIAGGLWSTTGLTLQSTDFTIARPPRDARAQFDLIVCNPPYVRHHHLDGAVKQRLAATLAERLAIRPHGLTGLYCYFLLLADAWLAPHGLAAWLIPTEFMDVNYGVAVKEYLLRHTTLLRLHRFLPDDVQFSDALVTSTVAIFRKARPVTSHRVLLTAGGSLGSPHARLERPQQTLDAREKWSRYFTGAAATATAPAALCLGDLFAIRRGLATGANDFFIMERQHATRLRLPARYLRPILPGPRYVTATHIRADRDGYPKLSRQLVLLDCDLPRERLDAYPALRAYVREGEDRGLAERYLTRGRSPWYRQESRPAAPLLCTYMARGGANRPAFRFFRNRSAATAHNVYLLLYPRPALAAALKRSPKLLDRIHAVLNGLKPADVETTGRVYGGGLKKMEPAELAALPLPLAAPDVRSLGTIAPAPARRHQLALFA